MLHDASRTYRRPQGSRPERFDYSWTGLGRWVDKAVDALDFDRFYFVIHDPSGPVGLEFLASHPERIASLTPFLQEDQASALVELISEIATSVH